MPKGDTWGLWTVERTPTMQRKRKYPGASKRAPPGKKARYATIPRNITNDYRILRNPRMEYKVWDFDKSSTNATTTIGIYNLSSAGTTTAALARGTASYQNFLGNIIDIQSIELNWEVVGGTASGGTPPDNYNVTRIMLFQWNDDAAPIAATVLQNTATAVNGPLSPIFFDNKSEINVLADIRQVTHPVSADAIAGGMSNSFNGKRYIKGKKLMPVSFLSSAVTYQKGGLWVLVVSDSAATPHPSVNMWFRITFVE